MDLNLSGEQQQLVDAFGALYAKESSTERVRAAEPLGHDPNLWARLKENGAVEMAVDEDSGGSGASLLDLALVAEQHGRYLGPAPLVEAQVAARLLARIGSDAARKALAPVLDGTRLVTMALHPPPAGVLPLVPAGAVCDDVIFLDGRRVALLTPESKRPAVANIGSLPLADLEVPASMVVLASGEGAERLFEEARRECCLLYTSRCV